MRVLSATAGLAVLAAGLLTTGPAGATAQHTFCDYVVSVDKAPFRSAADSGSKVLAELPVGTPVQLNQATYNGYHPGTTPNVWGYGWILDSQVRVIDGTCKSY